LNLLHSKGPLAIHFHHPSSSTFPPWYRYSCRGCIGTYLNPSTSEFSFVCGTLAPVDYHRRKRIPKLKGMLFLQYVSVLYIRNTTIPANQRAPNKVTDIGELVLLDRKSEAVRQHNISQQARSIWFWHLSNLTFLVSIAFKFLRVQDLALLGAINPVQRKVIGRGRNDVQRTMPSAENQIVTMA
jgi:hypothetical protein